LKGKGDNMKEYRVAKLEILPDNKLKLISTKYCKGIKELRKYTNYSIHYSYNAKGWFGIDNNIEYIAKEY
jgi:hypothetical protein